jgi:hypothetical protein
MGHVVILGQTKEFWLFSAWSSSFSFISAPVQQLIVDLEEGVGVSSAPSNIHPM